MADPDEILIDLCDCVINWKGKGEKERGMVCALLTSLWVKKKDGKTVKKEKNAVSIQRGRLAWVPRFAVRDVAQSLTCLWPRRGATLSSCTSAACSSGMVVTCSFHSFWILSRWSWIQRILLNISRKFVLQTKILAKINTRPKLLNCWGSTSQSLGMDHFLDRAVDPCHDSTTCVSDSVGSENCGFFVGAVFWQDGRRSCRVAEVGSFNPKSEDHCWRSAGAVQWQDGRCSTDSGAVSYSYSPDCAENGKSATCWSIWSSEWRSPRDATTGSRLSERSETCRRCSSSTRESCPRYQVEAGVNVPEDRNSGKSTGAAHWQYDWRSEYVCYDDRFQTFSGYRRRSSCSSLDGQLLSVEWRSHLTTMQLHTQQVEETTVLNIREMQVRTERMLQEQRRRILDDSTYELGTQKQKADSFAQTLEGQLSRQNLDISSWNFDY